MEVNGVMTKQLSLSVCLLIAATLLSTAIITCIAATAFSQERLPEKSPSASEVPSKYQNGTKPENQTAQGGAVLKPLDFQRVQWAYQSLYITAIGVSGCILALFVCLYKGEDVKKRFEPFFGDGQVTQLVVIIAVAGNVCSLAIAGILGASEVSAIYGGIVGYVLGKGKHSSNADATNSGNGRNTQDAATPQR